MALWQAVSSLKPIVDGVRKYLHFDEFIRVSMRSELRGVHEFFFEEEFWRKLIGSNLSNRLVTDRLMLNDVVRLRGFLVSEWFPRSPGTYWTPDGEARRTWAMMHKEQWDHETEVLGPTGKSYLVTGGIGTCRVMAHKGADGNQYGLLCATSSGRCDAGVPVVMPKDLYDSALDRLYSAARQGTTLAADITGQLLALPFDRNELLMSARGANTPSEIRNLLAEPLDVPAYYLRVESILNFTSRSSASEIEASAWTLYSDEDGAWSYTYASFDPRDPHDVERASDFLRDYIRRHRGRCVYTDFDEHTKRLDARHTIGSVMKKEANMAADVDSFLDWASTLQGARELRDPHRYM